MATSKQVKKVPNPTGKGGFQERPQDRSKGHWDSTMVFSYQYRRFMNMTTAELMSYGDKPTTERTVVEDLAYSRVIAAKKSLADVKEITDRTEGKPNQAIALSHGIDSAAILLEEYGIIKGKNDDRKDDGAVPSASKS